MDNLSICCSFMQLIEITTNLYEQKVLSISKKHHQHAFVAMFLLLLFLQYGWSMHQGLISCLIAEIGFRERNP